MSSHARLTVTIHAAGKVLHRAVLPPGTWTIGSGADSDLRLPHPSVDPLHAVLVFKGGAARLHATGRTGAVRVNGQPTRAAAVRSGDVLECAPFLVQFHLSAGRPAVRRVGVGTRRAPPAKLRLFFELSWGGARQYSKSFSPRSGPIVARQDDRAPVPLWGFSLEKAEHVIAAPYGDGYDVTAPPRAQVTLLERRGDAPSRRSLGAGVRVNVTDGMSLLLSEGEMTLRVSASAGERMPLTPPWRDLPVLAIVCLLAVAGAFGAFVSMAPDESELALARPWSPPPVAVKMLVSKPPRKPEEKRTKKEEKAAPERIAKRVPREPLRALAKLSNAGLATRTLLTSTAHLRVDTSPPKSSRLSALLAMPAAPANALGLGGASGRPTSGFELLRGAGGAGIGALGARGMGRDASIAGAVRRVAPRGLGVQGTIDRDAVAKVINSNLQVIRGCYERALLKSPGLAGKVVLEWSVSTAGQVLSARTKSSSLRSADVEQCILRSLKGWRFPAARGGLVVITYPFLFDAVGF